MSDDMLVLISDDEAAMLGRRSDGVMTLAYLREYASRPDGTARCSVRLGDARLRGICPRNLGSRGRERLELVDRPRRGEMLNVELLAASIALVCELVRGDDF